MNRLTIAGLGPRAFAEYYFSAWNRQRIERLADTYTADVVYRDLNLSITCRGLDELAAFMRFVFDASPDIAFRTLDVIAESPERLAVRWSMTSTSDSKPYDIEGSR